MADEPLLNQRTRDVITRTAVNRPGAPTRCYIAQVRLLEMQDDSRFAAVGESSFAFDAENPNLAWDAAGVALMALCWRMPPLGAGVQIEPGLGQPFPDV